MAEGGGTWRIRTGVVHSLARPPTLAPPLTPPPRLARGGISGPGQLGLYSLRLDRWCTFFGAKRDTCQGNFLWREKRHVSRQHLQLHLHPLRLDHGGLAAAVAALVKLLHLRGECEWAPLRCEWDVSEG